MNIVFLTTLNPYDINNWSGTTFHLLQALSKKHNVKVIGQNTLSQTAYYINDNFYYKINTTMIFYDFLFYKGVELGIKTKNYVDVPMLGGLAVVAPVIGFNLISVFMALDIFLNYAVMKTAFSINKILLAVLFLSILTFYYGFKSRYKVIIENYDKKRKKGNIYDLHPALIIIPTLLVSAGLIFLLIYIASIKKTYG